MVAYEVKQYTIRLNLYNLFDKDYYEGVYAGHSIPGLARTARITAELKF